MTDKKILEKYWNNLNIDQVWVRNECRKIGIGGRYLEGYEGDDFRKLDETALMVLDDMYTEPTTKGGKKYKEQLIL